MTKKKTSRKKHQGASAFADTSEEELNDTRCQAKCPHVSRAVNFGRIKKGLKNTVNLNICMGCLEKSTDGDVVDEDNLDVEVWMCLQCGYRGCGRLSPNQHAIQHNKTLHSDCHSLVLSILSNILWCYDCDREVQLSTTNLKQCVDFITKFKSKNENNFALIDVKKESVVQPERGDSPTVEKPQDIKQVLSVAKPGNLLKSSKKGTIHVDHAQVKGLKNLGNTCFFNAVMQNLSLTTLLEHELNNSSNSEYLWEVPHLIVNQEDVIEDETNKLKVSLPNQLVLAQALSQFLREMSTSGNKVVNPGSLFGEIAKKSPQFRHFQQQDSHELLRHLLDGVRQEEVKRQKRGILKAFKLENKSPESVNEETKKLVKAYGCYASHTLVEKIFGGLLISTVLCEECKMSSQVFEPFMDLSLPVFEEKATRNQKVEKDSDENVTDGFLLTKESKGLTKPSKHQEKKMKQQAKRDRKKGRDLMHDKLTIADFNKDEKSSSLCENPKPEDEKVNNEDVTAEDPTANDMSEMAPTANDMSEMAPTANDMSEMAPTSNDMSETAPTANDMSEIAPTANDMSETGIDGKKESSNEVRNTLEDNNNALQDESVQSLHDAPYQIDQTENHESKNLSADEFPENELIHQSIEASETPHPTTETATKDTLHSTQDITEKLDHDSQDAMENPDDDQQGIMESTNHNSEDTAENLNHDTQDTMENLDHNIQDSTEDPDHDTQSTMENTDHNSQDTVKNLNLDTRDATENPDRDIQDIMEGRYRDTRDIFNTQESSALEDRLQTLCSQITDMRIRRDSYRQENLLVSSRNSSDGDTPRLNTSHESLADDTIDDRYRGNWSRSVSEEHTKEWIMRSLTTLKQRCHASPLEVSIISCLSHFTKSELLTGNNKFRCENCTSVRRKRMNSKTEVAYTNASKQLLIFSPPAILTLHLKRFQQVGFTLKKVNRFVEFPLVLDLAPYCSSASLILPHMAAVKDEVLYSLYGIVEHSGRLNNGHYTAFVKASHMPANHSFMNQWPLGQCDLEQLLQKFSKIKSPAEDGTSGSNDEEDRRWFYVSDCHSKEVKEADVLRCQAYILFYQRIK